MTEFNKKHNQKINHNTTVLETLMSIIVKHFSHYQKNNITRKDNINIWYNHKSIKSSSTLLDRESSTVKKILKCKK